MPKDSPPPGISGKLLEIIDQAKPAGLSMRQWLIAASLSSSFITDLRNGAEPGIDKVERMARAIGLPLSQFIEGYEPPIRLIPTVEDLQEMLSDAQNEVRAGASLGDWPQYVAPALLTRLERYQADRATSATEGKVNESDKVSRPRRSTKRAAQA